jgi:hypothetical protein
VIGVNFKQLRIILGGKDVTVGDHRVRQYLEGVWLGTNLATSEISQDQ